LEGLSESCPKLLDEIVLKPDSKEDKGTYDEKKYALMQGVLSKTLLYGVILSTAIVIIGLIYMAATYSTGYQCDFTGASLSCLLNYNAALIPHGDYPNTLVSIATGVVALKPFAIIELGVVVLLATPVFRVAASLVLFAIEKDRAFVLITLFVLLVLLFSFFVVPFIPLFKA
jgi:uncharacterized membrane protein